MREFSSSINGNSPPSHMIFALSITELFFSIYSLMIFASLIFLLYSKQMEKNMTAPMKKNTLVKAVTKKLPERRGGRRLWIESFKLLETSIGQKGTFHYTIDFSAKQMRIVSGAGDNRKITLRKNGLPVIDICNKEIAELYKDIEKVTIKIGKNEIVVEPLKEEVEQKRAKRKLHDEDITFTDIFAGGSTLTEAMKLSGMIPVSAIEIDERYVSNYIENNPYAFVYHTSVVDMDESLLPDSTVLVGGIPCEDYSVSGVSCKKAKGCDVGLLGKTGALGYYFLQAVKKIRPAVCVIEEVPNFKHSEMRDLIVSVLGFMGYTVSEKILKSDEFGSMTRRKRYCMVATIGEKFHFPNIIPKSSSRCIRDILEIPVEKREWLSRETSATLAYTLDKELKNIQSKNGNNFRIGRVYLDDRTTPTVTKGYYKFRTTDPILVHPHDNTLYSRFTPRELARLHGLPDTFKLPRDNKGNVKKSVSGEIVGQGVSIEPSYM
jgi:DNA (cytosine-5)-methyltransferase 1